MTGRLRPALLPRKAGVNTFRTRQSSLCWSGGPAAVVPELSPPCGAVGPKASASRVPVHAAGFTGGMKRFGPLVGAPYGMPFFEDVDPVGDHAAHLAGGGVGDSVFRLGCANGRQPGGCPGAGDDKQPVTSGFRRLEVMDMCGMTGPFQVRTLSARVSFH